MKNLDGLLGWYNESHSYGFRRLQLSWKYNITFTDNDSAYVGIARSGTIRDENGTSIGSNKITQPAVNFLFKTCRL